MRFALRPLCLAAIIFAAAGPEPAIAGKKQNTAFKIDLTLEGVCLDVLEWGLGNCSGWDGGFKASGALSDRGAAGAPYYSNEFPVQLDGKNGSLSLVLSLGAFEIVGGTGAYADATGGGTATLDVDYLGYPSGKVDWDNDRYVRVVQKWSLEGTLD